MANEAKNAANAQEAAESNAEQTVDTAAATSTQTKKPLRRGVASARGVTRLKFTHELAQNNGLFITHIEDVVVSKILIGESTTGMPSFNGLEIPKISIHVASNEEDVNKRHHVTLSFNAVESNVKTIPGGSDEWKVNAVLDYLKHILDVFVFKGRALTDAEEEALSLDFADFDEQGEYVAVESEVVIEAYTKLFENVQALLNTSNDGKPAYKTKDGKIIPIWTKLLRYTKNNKKKEWIAINNGDLSFPTFLGEGVMEIWRQNTKPSLRIDIIKECITPKDIDKAKAPSTLGAGGVPMMGGPDMSGFSGMSVDNGFNAAAASDDMPF